MEPTMNSTKIAVLLMLAAVGGIALSGCAEQRNLKEANAAYDKLNLGMSAQETCASFGIDCPPERKDLTHSRDFGMSLSYSVYMVTVYVRNDRLVRVELAKPYYEGHTRRDDHDKINVIRQMGISYEELYQPAEKPAENEPENPE